MSDKYKNVLFFHHHEAEYSYEIYLNNNVLDDIPGPVFTKVLLEKETLELPYFFLFFFELKVQK